MTGSKWFTATTAFAALTALWPMHVMAHGSGEHVDRSEDPGWAILQQVSVAQAPPDYQFRATVPANIQALVGREFSISGYAVSLDQEGKTDHFLLSRSSPECPYHTAALPNEVIEVRLASAIRVPLGRQIRITGQFGLQNNTHTGLLFYLEDGEQL